ncbi:MAG: class I SAM-dependent methyltransferase [Elusimicrobia bacterium]|nr:class I SAM-dependent methyltransferase [Candidatus Liberimonas magnetica]
MKLINICAAGISLGLGISLILLTVHSPKVNYGELTKLADKYKTDKGSNIYINADGKGQGHHFTEVYEYFFKPIRMKANKILEIGVEHGGSEFMWRDYFPNAIIYGIDIADCSKFNSGRIKTYIADQLKRDQLKGFIDKYGKDFDFILDDGGHWMDEQQTSFGYLFPYVKSGGYYIIEDVHTSFLNNYGVEPDGSNSTYTMITNYIKNAKIVSKYMTEVESAYIANNIDYCNLFSRDKGLSAFCIFKKK